MAKKNDNGETSPATERETAPETVTATITSHQPLQPWQMMTSRSGTGAPMVRHFPQVRGGVCERCGVLDRDVPSQYQYRLCGHYRGMTLACNYCPSTVDSDDVVRSTTLNITSHPYNPGELVVVCDRYDCVRRHREKWTTAA